MTASSSLSPQQAQATLAALEPGTDTDTALGFYDTLPSVASETMIGSWRGTGLHSGHPLDGLLELYRWHGKRFDDLESVHPLVFADGRGALTSINPAFIPLPALTRFGGVLHRPIIARAFGLLRGVLATRAPRARLRMTEYRGVVSATMVYDALPINDVFRMVDIDTVVGAMDMRGLTDPLLFVLRREEP